MLDIMLFAIIALSLSLIAALIKIAQYKARIDKIQHTLWVAFDNAGLFSGTELLDAVMRDIWHTLYD
jgi:hypothetical protein|nr:MAG TPA: hypothetical protein [Caudoviricetes sp.]